MLLVWHVLLCRQSVKSAACSRADDDEDVQGFTINYKV